MASLCLIRDNGWWPWDSKNGSHDDPVSWMSFILPADLLSTLLHPMQCLWGDLLTLASLPSCFGWIGLSLASRKNQQDVQKRKRKGWGTHSPSFCSVGLQWACCVPWGKVMASIKRPSPHNSLSFCSYSKHSLPCTIPFNFFHLDHIFVTSPLIKLPLNDPIWVYLLCPAWALTDTKHNTTLDLHNTWQNNMHSCQQKSSKAVSRYYHDHIIEVETSSDSKQCKWGLKFSEFLRSQNF